MKDWQNTNGSFFGLLRQSLLALLCLTMSTQAVYGKKTADERSFSNIPPQMASIQRQIKSNYQNENFETVIALCSRGIKEFPKESQFYAKRADTYLLLCKTDLAIQDLTTAIKLDPKTGWLFVARGRAYDSQGKDKLALEDYNQGIALGCSMGYKDQARVLERTGQLVKAVDSLNKLMPTIGPLERIPFLFQRAKIYEKLGKTQLAKADKKLATDLLNKSGGQDADRYTR
ncbi:hypothetical protein BH11CYA1_BH11CYA1_03870 [soil metagenome]